MISCRSLLLAPAAGPCRASLLRTGTRCYEFVNKITSPATNGDVDQCGCSGSIVGSRLAERIT